MADFSRLIITEKGQALIAKIIVGNSSNIQFTRIATSNKEYQESELFQLTALEGIKQSSAVSNITQTNAVTIQVETAFTNAELQEGYYIKTMGLYAVDPDEGEILYAVTKATVGSCYIPPCNSITVSGILVQLVTTVGNSENVSFEVDPAAVATIRDIGELEKKVLPSGGKKGQILKKQSNADYDVIWGDPETDIDCGIFEDDSALQEHLYGENPHATMQVDGNATITQLSGMTLEEHMQDIQAHPNIHLDGNE